ncbi:type II toxin-antitoxin system tRNA(fMet)-specific endonuclease VapC [Deinococcus metallilatus]|uniref:Ribonuclease VapC n=1 Tax=Deinococcus metallilatus TaxID=1211322 RepID=A0ABR6MXT1_9DEIO|nr:type II toxin-antitoxin system VapC family toxin [Deinococcus metallilatus]MBB5296750.1 tRNA(fMet)-specific endonuclease VapC [Deinococcus metallilatus]GMA13781.1 ribonuclease VapC [Deinococcus metallilatus]
MALRFLLDTNICIYIMNKRPPHVAERFAQYPPDAIGLSSVTLAELSYGVEKSCSSRNQLVLQGFIAPLEVVPFGPEAAWRYGEVRSALERRGVPIGALDTLIAAHALALDLTLVTHNTREFERVVGLRVENWF